MKHIVTLKYTQGDKLCDSATKRVASRTGMPHRRSPGESSKMKLSVYSQGATVAFLPACCLPPREMDHQMPESRLCGTVEVPDSGPGDWRHILDGVDHSLFVFLPLEKAILLLTSGRIPH